MRALRLPKHAGIVLGLATVGLLAGVTPSETAQAATFPVHAFFRTDNTTLPSSGVGVPPPADWTYCKSPLLNCGFTIKKLTNLGAYVRPGFYRVTTTGLPADSIVFATPYGPSDGSNDAYCTVGGSINASKDINCSGATRLSVRYIGNNLALNFSWISTAWNAGGSGDAAYGYVDDFWTPSISTPHGVSFNSSGRRNVVRKTGVGRYTVTIPGMGESERSANGVAHVQAVTMPGNNAFEQKRICAIEEVAETILADPDALEVTLRCFGRNENREDIGFGGSAQLVPIDAPFNFLYEMPGGSLLRSVYSDRVVAPTAGYSPSKSSLSSITVKGTAEAGRYIVNLPNTAATGTNVQVTARGYGPKFCNVERWRADASGSGTDVYVGCFAMSNANVPVQTNMQFFLSYNRKR